MKSISGQFVHGSLNFSPSFLDFIQRVSDQSGKIMLVLIIQTLPFVGLKKSGAEGGRVPVGGGKEGEGGEREGISRFKELKVQGLDDGSMLMHISNL
eukprot:12407881-Karenia_brevis.AAC.1